VSLVIGYDRLKTAYKEVSITFNASLGSGSVVDESTFCAGAGNGRIKVLTNRNMENQKWAVSADAAMVLAIGIY
jgi:hypothetical protein